MEKNNVKMVTELKVNVSMNTSTASSIGDKLTKLILENEDKARLNLEVMEFTKEEIDNIVNDTKNRYSIALQQAKMDDLRDQLAEILNECINEQFPNMPEELQYGKIDLTFSRMDITVNGITVNKAIWEISKFHTRLKGDNNIQTSKSETSTSTSTKGGGGKRSVPIPQSLINAGIKSWTDYVEEKYPEEFKKHLNADGTKKSYNFTLILKAQKDDLYLQAAKDNGIDLEETKNNSIE